MGASISGLWHNISNKLIKSEGPILVLGFPNVGKSTILEKTRLGDIKVNDYNGLDVKTINSPGVRFVAWDLGEEAVAVRNKLLKYFYGCRGIIFVIGPDTSLTDARAELDKILAENGITQSIPLLILINTWFKGQSNRSAAEVCDSLGLHTVRIRPWSVQICAAKTGDGLFDGINWLASTAAAQ